MTAASNRTEIFILVRRPVMEEAREAILINSS